jgi:hypothetical protein
VPVIWKAVLDRAGNVFIAVVVGVLETVFSRKAPFFLLPVFGSLTIVAVLAIPARANPWNSLAGHTNGTVGPSVNGQTLP